MHILDLPPEVFDSILFHSILCRSLPRALRLKLVCKSFNAAFRSVLFATKVLDRERFGYTFKHNRRYYGVDTLWHDYLLFRCRNETDKTVGRFVEMRHLAVALHSHCEAQGIRPDLDSDAILDGLCWLALERGVHCPGKRLVIGEWPNETPDSRLDLLSAATYFSCLYLAKDLLEQGYDPREHDCLFPSAMYLAAWTGQATMLELMQEHLPDYEELGSGDPGLYSRSKINAQSLTGAAVRGDMEIVRQALYPPSRIIPPTNIDRQDKDGYMPDSELVLGYKPGHIPMGTGLRADMAAAMRSTSSPEVFQYLRDFLGQVDNSPAALSNLLAASASFGDIVMVQHLLDSGADVVGRSAHNGTPLLHAVRSFHEDMVDLLLESGADPNEWGADCRDGTVLTAAAKAGSLRILQKLINWGARINGEREALTLKYAVKLEHTAMVELLLRMGVGTGEERRSILDMAKDEGLESMIDILNS